jgi:alkanesulfonate monooxygenase SsuD/methylene tetrahydromethanopterin reductase-like flavin-dependent oxidoreductase (luciferase family)
VQSNIASVGAYSASTRARERALGAKLLADTRRISAGMTPRVGGPDEIAEQLIALVPTAGIDSLCLVFTDYLDGLRRFGSRVLPRLRDAFDVGTP